MTLALTAGSAEELYALLDTEIGVFRMEDMPEAGVRFYNDKRVEFIETFVSEIPQKYWFQGVEAPSVELHFDSTGFVLVTENPHKPVKEKIEATNKLLHDFDFEYLENDPVIEEQILRAEEAFVPEGVVAR